MSDVLVLGVTGMLGHAVEIRFTQDGLDWVGTTRRNTQDAHTANRVLRFGAPTDDIADVLRLAGYPRYIINAIGVIKPWIDDADVASRQRAIEINAMLPHQLAIAAGAYGAHVIQIATDCVYSGTEGGLTEIAPHDPHDIYGKTKSLGEVQWPNVTHIRCSIIGPEFDRASSLWEWVLNQPRDATVTGFTDHLWNGVTTQAFARLCSGIVRSGWKLCGTYHLVPANIVTKSDLVRCIAQHNGRGDIQVVDGLGPTPIDRSIATKFPEINDELWRIAGYENSPTIEMMIENAVSERA
jgi:dTDP-4-dehydrorhamnose reductase